MTDSIATLREQLRQLRQAHAAGTLDASTFAALKGPLEQRLLDVVLGPGGDPTVGATADAAMPIAAPVAPGATPSAATVAALAAPPPGRALTRLWISATVFIVGVALAGYAWMGSPGAIGQPPSGFTQASPAAAAAGGTDVAGGSAASAAAPAQPVTREQIDSMVTRLADHLQAQPDDADGWVMMGRSQMALEHPAAAITAYRRALALRPKDAGLLADTADAIAAGSERGLEGEPMALIAQSLQIEPGNLKALALSGSAALNRGDFAGAAQWWDRVVAIGPADSRLVELSRSGAVEARQRGKLAAAATAAASAPPAGTAAPANTTASAASATVTGTVSLAPALAAQASPGDTVFIFARPADGGRMPVAIVRRQVSDLPYRFVLDDSLSMSPTVRLSTAGRVIVGARISKSGQAMPQPGDLEGSSEPVAVGAQDIRIEIGRRLP
ncbi:MAG: hypothetical protein ABIN96_17610 [Rubrivivax sp.]